MRVQVDFTEEKTVYKNVVFKKRFLLGTMSLYVKDDEMYRAFPVNTNGWGRRPIDQGDWVLSPGLIQLKGKYIPESLKPYECATHFWYFRLLPKFKTDQTGILIHPDNGVVGTLGCIGVPREHSDQCRQALTTLLQMCQAQIRTPRQELIVSVVHRV